MRLIKDGMTQEELDEKVDALWKEEQ